MTDPKTFDSTSDQRTKNSGNSTRATYRTLTDTEKRQMTDIKERAANLIKAISDLDGQQIPPDRISLADRNLEIARRAVEDAAMRAAWFITDPDREGAD